VDAERSAFSVQADGLWRAYRLPRQELDTGMAWYRDTLSQAPWALQEVKTNRRRGDDRIPDWVRYCLRAALPDGGGEARPYHVEVAGFERPGSNVFVTIGTPNPLNPVCHDYIQQVP
jgi:hypothetical protein